MLTHKEYAPKFSCVYVESAALSTSSSSLDSAVNSTIVDPFRSLNCICCLKEMKHLASMLWKKFSIWVFFYKHSQITGLQDFHLLHRHLDISRAITVQSSPLHIASSQTRTGNLWFLSTNRLSLSYAPLYTSYTIIKKVVSVEKLFIMIILFMSCLSKPSFIFLKTVMSCITNCYNWKTKIFQCFYSLPLPKIAFSLEANLR